MVFVQLWNYPLLPKLELTFFGIFPLWAVSWWCDQVQFFGEEFYELKKFLLCSWRKSSFHWEPSWKNKLMYLGWVLFWPGPWRCILVSCLGICNLIWWNATVAEKEAFLGLVTTVVDYSFTSTSYLTRVLWDKRFMMNCCLGLQYTNLVNVVGRYKVCLLWVPCVSSLSYVAWTQTRIRTGFLKYRDKAGDTAKTNKWIIFILYQCRQISRSVKRQIYKQASYILYKHIILHF